MTRNWAKRIQRLESILQTRNRPPVVFRYGSVRRLSKDLPGERHVAVSKSERTALSSVERCEFEERVGPAPPGDELSFNVYLSWEDETEIPS